MFLHLLKVFIGYFQHGDKLLFPELPFTLFHKFLITDSIFKCYFSNLNKCYNIWKSQRRI